MRCRFLLVLTSFLSSIAAQSTEACTTNTANSGCTVPPSSPSATCPTAPSRSTPPPCRSTSNGLHIIISRATLECMGYGTSYDVVKAVKAQLPDWDIDVDYNPYPATASRSFISGEYIYRKSVTEGVENLTNMIKQYSAACQNVSIVLVGYSQGAHVTSNVLWGNKESHPFFYFPLFEPIPYTDNIKAVILFGDPSFDPSVKEINCGTYNGYGSWFYRGPITGSNYFDRTRSYCNANDSFCDCDEDNYISRDNHCLKNPDYLNIHKGYLYCDVYTQNAANFIVGLVQSSKTSDDWKEGLK